MTRVAIVTDSSADLAPHIAVAEGIVIVPVSVSLGAESVRGHEYMPSGTGGRSGQPIARDAEAPAEIADAFATAFAGLIDAHDDIVAVLLSSRLGAAVAAARQARKRFAGKARIEVIDSRSASLGLGFQALHASELARQGANADAIGTALRDAIDRYHVVFSVESVMHLRQSGQIGRSAAMIAEALQIKPLLRIDEGQIVPYERARTRIGAIGELAAFVRELPAVERCAVLYSSNRADAMELERAIAMDTEIPPDRLSVARIGAAIAGHVGPGALGVAVVEPDLR